MASSRSVTDLKVPRRIFRRVIVEKNPSTALSHEADVGVKWNVHRGWSASHARTLGCLCVIIGDGMNDLSGGDGSFDSVQELNELLMPMLFHATPDNGSIQDVERGEQRSRAVAFVIVRHGTAFPGLEWQARLGAIERLDLAFFIDGDDDRMSRRRHIEADDILDFLGEFGIGGTLERADAMRLKAMGSPQALD